MREKRRAKRGILFFGSLFLAFILCAVPARGLALASQAGIDTTGSMVFDAANLLSSEEETRLNQKIQTYSQKYDCDIAIVTTQDAGGKTAMEYADDYAESLGMSMTLEGKAGILFLIDMDNREIYISTSGLAISYYSDERIDKVLDACYYKIIDGDYYGTCAKFLKGVYDYMGRSPSRSARMDLMGVLIRLAASLGLGGVITFLLVRTSGSRVTAGAANYLDTASSRMVEKGDRFVNRTVTRRRIPRANVSGGGGGRGGGFHGGGGGSFHVSGGGGFHGGGGRKF